MPLERISKGFKDLSMTFQINPLNYDLIALKNETAIARSLRNLVLTAKGERFFNPSLGSGVSRLLFDNIDNFTAREIKSEVEYTINTFEPRVRLIDVLVNPDYDNNEFNVTITYQIVGINVPSQQLVFVLQPTR
jgi:phage baseplate assembly protein W